MLYWNDGKCTCLQAENEPDQHTYLKVCKLNLSNLLLVQTLNNDCTIESAIIDVTTQL